MGVIRILGVVALLLVAVVVAGDEGDAGAGGGRAEDKRRLHTRLILFHFIPTSSTSSTTNTRTRCFLRIGYAELPERHLLVSFPSTAPPTTGTEKTGGFCLKRRDVDADKEFLEREGSMSSPLTPPSLEQANPRKLGLHAETWLTDLRKLVIIFNLGIGYSFPVVVVDAPLALQKPTDRSPQTPPNRSTTRLIVLCLLPSPPASLWLSLFRRSHAAPDHVRAHSEPPTFNIPAARLAQPDDDAEPPWPRLPVRDVVAAAAPVVVGAWYGGGPQWSSNVKFAVASSSFFQFAFPRFLDSDNTLKEHSGADEETAA
ncbi:hypothetical protein BDZ97DRAFT_1925143 [Flammula alnicola]|nr:hypothetical protein BDZ97DRAFT_1925143 [Flammula alnicola]